MSLTNLSAGKLCFMVLAMPLTRPELRPSAPVPLYEQIADHIAAAVADGSLMPGEKLPGERDLADEWGVGYPTVRRAMEVLRERGLIETRHGKGTFARQPE